MGDGAMATKAATIVESVLVDCCFVFVSHVLFCIDDINAIDDALIASESLSCLRPVELCFAGRERVAGCCRCRW